ncbi:MAG: hypothetical protein KGD73_04090 [Candidatus Lokiarchaeota archaeon]|nr:hypothetical protein [Candidatus Lokiarchaeota archaeon]
MERIIHKEKLTNHSEWNESYYFVFFDKSNNMGGMSRIGFKPNKREGMTFFFLFLADGSAAGYHQEVKLEDFSENLRVGGMSHSWQKDETWKYFFKGRMIFVADPLNMPRVREDPKLILKSEKVSMDLTFNPLNNIYEYSKYMTPESLEIGKKSGDKHWEQIGSVEGKIKIGQVECNISSVLGQRDHTYGVRDWTGVGNWLYYVVWFNESLAINPAAIVTDDGRMSIGGFLFRDGKNIPLRSIHIIQQEYDEKGIYPISSELQIIDDLGEDHNLKAEVGPIIPVPFKDEEGNQSILIQSFGKFELDGIQGGYGTFETLRKVRN